MLPYSETLMPKWKKLTDGTIPAPFQFSNFEESVQPNHPEEERIVRAKKVDESQCKI